MRKLFLVMPLVLVFPLGMYASAFAQVHIVKLEEGKPLDASQRMQFDHAVEQHSTQQTVLASHAAKTWQVSVSVTEPPKPVFPTQSRAEVRSHFAMILMSGGRYGGSAT